MDLKITTSSRSAEAFRSQLLRQQNEATTVAIIQIIQMNGSKSWLERNWSQHKVSSNFFSDFLIILQQQKTSHERNDIVILFSFW